MGRVWSRPLRELSIRVRLVILFAVIVLPLLASRTLELRREGAERLASAGQHVAALAARAVERQEDVISEVRTLLDVFSRVPDVRAGNPEDCRQFLLTGTNKPWLKGVWAVEPSGIVSCSTVPGGVGVDFAAALYFRKALETKSFVLDHYLLGRSGGQPAAVAALPILDADKNVTRVMMASVDMAWLGSVASEVAGTEGASILLIDGRGTILFRQPDLQNLTGRNVGERKLVRAMATLKKGQVEGEGFDGVTRLYGFARLPGTDAQLAIGLSKREILADINRQVWVSLVSFGLVSLLGSLAAWFGGEAFLSKPIREMAATASRFGAGDYSLRPPVSAERGEFGVLAAALNEMADELEAREGRLRATADRMAMLAENDALTGLPNRRLFDRRLFAAWQASVASGSPVSLLLIDLDHFTSLKSSKGPVFSDDYLRSVGGIIGTLASAEGRFAARIGGDEFAIVLPQTEAARAVEIAEEIRAQIEALRLEQAQASGGVLTASIGVAARVASADRTPTVLVGNADAALYAAKRLGSNRVVASTEADLRASSWPPKPRPEPNARAA